MIALGFDTSNYTTSAAWTDGAAGDSAGRLLEVRPGELGLRQSEALFQHVKRLPEILEGLALPGKVSAVGASTRPRSQPGSYMPCFLAGESQGRSLARVLGVPFFACSHQEGHLAAVLWSAGRMELMDREFLAWHLSGGTTELLHVLPGLRAEIIGGTEDLSAGQLIDRTGQLLGLSFPAGKALDALAGEREAKPYAVKLRGLRFSLSGMQNKAADLFSRGAGPEDTAAFVLSCIAGTVRRTTEKARKEWGDLPVVFSGGVSSNRQLRRTMVHLGAVFGEPRYSTDNAMGVAVLTHLAEEGSWTNN